MPLPFYRVDQLPKPENSSHYLFVCCQNGAQSALKREFAREYPDLRLAFSRPGFVTFKAINHEIPEKFALRSTFARTAGWSVGKASGTDGSQLCQKVAEIFNELAKTDDEESPLVHVFERDLCLPGKNDFEPGITPLATEIGKQLKQHFEKMGVNPRINQMASPEERVFDVVVVDPTEWWIGYHYANTIPSRWPGGIPRMDASDETISRAYFKTQEALLWAGIRLQTGDVCAEIGSAPGGCCQFLLERGAHVIGIDPAEMDPSIAEHENFVHIRRRGHEVRKRDLRDVKWLFADIRADPDHSIDAVASVIEHKDVNPSGIFLTLKMAEEKYVDEIPRLMDRVRSIGFAVVKSRQLAFNRREFCLFAAKDKYLLRQHRQTRQV